MAACRTRKARRSKIWRDACGELGRAGAAIGGRARGGPIWAEMKRLLRGVRVVGDGGRGRTGGGSLQLLDSAVHGRCGGAFRLRSSRCRTGALGVGGLAESGWTRIAVRGGGRRIHARIRVYWLGKRPQLYGDTRLVFVNGKRGAVDRSTSRSCAIRTAHRGRWRERQTVPRYGRLFDVPARDRACDWLAAHRRFRRHHVQLPVRRRCARIFQSLSAGTSASGQISASIRGFPRRTASAWPACMQAVDGRVRMKVFTPLRGRSSVG